MLSYEPHSSTRDLTVEVLTVAQACLSVLSPSCRAWLKVGLTQGLWGSPLE